MNCYLHPDVPAVAYCRTCGRGVCAVCQRPAEGTVFCVDHVPAAAYADPYAAAPNPYVAPPPVASGSGSPGLAFALGLIPGVGAIYNGQYVKGLTHALAFGLLIGLANTADGTAGQPMLVMLVVAFYCYMPIEAYHTARKRVLGLPVDEWSSLMQPGRPSARVPIGPVVLIAIGFLFLLDSMHLIAFHEIARFWPVLLILVGALMLYSRVTNTSRTTVEPPVGRGVTPDER